MIWLVALSAMSVGGCARYRLESPASLARAPAAEPRPLHSLDEVTVESRHGIRHPLMEPSRGGTPLSFQPMDPIQTLGVRQCEVLAAEASPLARAIDHQIRQLQCADDVPACLPEILHLAAEHERNESAGKAAEVYVQLAGVYLQHDVLQQSKRELESLETILDKAKANQLTLDVDERMVDRRRIELSEQELTLRHAQEQLSAGLRLLLDVQQTDMAIWTDWQATASDGELELQSSLQLAWENRSDLMAQELLIECCRAELMEVILAGVRSLSPFLGLAVGNQGPLRSLLSSPTDCDACVQATQLRLLLEAQETRVAAEITELISSIRRRVAGIRLKQQKLASYQASIDDADRRAEVQPVDLRTRFENKAELLRVKWEIVQEVVQLEIDRIRLRRAQGLMTASPSMSEGASGRVHD